MKKPEALASWFCCCEGAPRRITRAFGERNLFHPYIAPMPKTQIIHAISGPRNISTAAMYSFAQRPGCAVIDEPFYAHYLKKESLEHPGRDVILNEHPADLAKVHEKIQNLIEDGHREVYLKNMAHHMEGLSYDWAKEAAHLFWIRHPRRVVQSFSKVIRHVIIDDVGIEAQWEQWQKIQSFPVPKVVVDSDELLANPARNLPLVCEALGIPWSPNMLTWPKGPKHYDGAWAPHWYERVHRSTQFGAVKPLPKALDEPLEDLVHYLMPTYERLWNERLFLKT